MSRIPKPVRDALKKRASCDEQPCCERCGNPRANNAHHRMNRSQGGRNVLSNLLWLCGSGVTGCHGWATLNPSEAWADGFVVKPWEDPAKKAVRFASGAEVLLTDDGDYRSAA